MGYQIEAALGGLAFTMMERRLRDLPRPEVLRVFREELLRASTKISAEDVLGEVGTSGLLVERKSDWFSFAHLGLQEYLAAVHIRDRGLVDVLADAVDDPWWRETTLLYASHSEAGQIVRACLSSGTAEALSLAIDCVDQGAEVSPELRERLGEMLNPTSVADISPGNRRVIARTLLTRHLRPVTRPITEVVYQLFQREIPGHLPDRAPGLRTMDDPVLGVRASDAMLFTLWANGIMAGVVYRLPTRGEVESQGVPWSVWVEPDSEHGEPELWTPPGAPTRTLSSR